MSRAEIVVDLAAIRHNVALLRETVAPAAMMTVVKADGYGHGLLRAARAARAAGSEWLGVATIDEALALRADGDAGPILSWLTVPGEERYAAAMAADVDLTAYTVAELADIARAVEQAGRPARVQLKADTGLSRGGATSADWPGLVAAACEGEQRGDWRVTGIWSHFACSDEPHHPSNDRQEEVFREALALADAAGLRPDVRHLANSAAAILRPSSRFDLVRCGIASYGCNPAPAVLNRDVVELPLRPAMTARARLALTKQVEAGVSVSYGHTWTADRPTSLGLVPVGYGDGVLRHASNAAEVWIAGARRPVRGRICMDQFVVDLGEQAIETGAIEAGEEVVLFGPGDDGEPTADDWARACGTINYEIVTRIGGRFERRYVNESDEEDQP